MLSNADFILSITSFLQYFYDIIDYILYKEKDNGRTEK